MMKGLCFILISTVALPGCTTNELYVSSTRKESEKSDTRFSLERETDIALDTKVKSDKTSTNR